MATDRSERLESWKEIAAYLGRSTRTVQRWERLEGLPVHRLVHDKLGSVYADPAELDAWWEGRRNRLQDASEDEGPEPESPPDLQAPGRASRWAGPAVVVGALMTGLLAWSLVRSRPSTAKPTRLAVLPFANLTGDPEQEFLGDGLTEELTAELGRLPHLGVIARTSVMRFKGATKGVDQIGRELRVDYVLEGSVRQAHRRLRVTAQLIRVADEVHVWAESYDGELKDLIGVQRQIARSVAEEARLHTLAAAPDPAVDPDAYIAYLRGRYHWNKRTQVGFDQGLGLFRQAIEKDPGFARAWTGLADSYMLMGNYGYVAAGEAAARARQAAVRALQLRPDLADAHASLGLILASHDWDFPRAEQEFRRALELNPGHALARFWYGLLLLDLGRDAEARTQIEAGLDADPLSESLRAKLADCDFNEGRRERALQAKQAATESSPESPSAWSGLGRVYLQLGRAEEGLTAVSRARELNPQDTGIAALHACALARAQRSGEARQVLDRLVAEADRRYVPPYDLAIAANGLGDKERALAWLTEAVEQRYVGARFMARDSTLASLRGDRRFQELVARVGLGTAGASPRVAADHPEDLSRR